MIVNALAAIYNQNYSIQPTLTEKLQECLRDEQDNKWELCSICYEIKNQEEWKKLGFQSLKAYIDELRTNGYHIYQKTFSEFVRVRDFILKFNIEKDFFMRVGFYKFRELVTLMDYITYDEMLDFISKLSFISVRELRRIKNEILGPKKKNYKNNEKENNEE